MNTESFQKEWKFLQQLLSRAEQAPIRDHRQINGLKKRINELKPHYSDMMRQVAQAITITTTDHTTPADTDTSSRFNFYMTAVPSSSLDQLCHAVFAQWLTFRGFKRQTSAEKLADYRQMITCVVCNLAYAGVVRVSRDKVDFARATSHYRPSVFNKRFLAVLDDLHTMGTIIQTKGQRYKRNYAHDFGVSKAKYLTQDSILTRLTAGSLLANQLQSVTREQVHIETDTQEVVMLKRDAGSDLVEYPETARTRKYRRQVKIINRVLAHAGSLLSVEGQKTFDQRSRFLVRKFTYSNFEKGGRLWGGFWDSPMKKIERSTLLCIQGQPTAEVDFNSVIIHLAYALHGDEPPAQEDMYLIPGLHPESRPGIKKFISAGLFRESTRKRFPKDRDSGQSILDQFHPSDRCKSYSQVLTLIEAVHPSLVLDFFGTGVGHHLQFLESQLMVNLLLKACQQGLVCLPLHDCLIVREDQVGLTEILMKKVSLEVLGREIPVSKRIVQTTREAA